MRTYPALSDYEKYQHVNAKRKSKYNLARQNCSATISTCIPDVGESSTNIMAAISELRSILNPCNMLIGTTTAAQLTSNTVGYMVGVVPDHASGTNTNR